MTRIILVVITAGFSLAGLAQVTNKPTTNAVAAAGAPPPSAPAQRSAADLEKLAMPVALHPDPLISIILPASVYPVEIVQAARFVKNTNNIAQVDQQPWDENVRAVAKFPDVISLMDSNLAWTIELGRAFVDQPKELMDTIQSLRGKAAQAGTLQSSPQQVVTVTNEVVVQTNVTQVVAVTNQIVQIQPANPEIIYVPTYSSTVYAPPPYYVYDPVAPLVTFGVGMAMGAVIANNCDWHGGGVWVGGRGVAVWGGGYHGDVDVDIDRDVNINQSANVNRDVNRNVNRTTAQSGNKAQQQKWQPNQTRMQTSGAGASPQTREARGWGGASSQQSAQAAQGSAAMGGRTPPSRPPESGAGASRPASPSATRPAPSQPAASRPTPSPSPSRPAGGGQAPAQSVSRPTPTPTSSSPAFSGVSSGGGARDYSSRGSASRGSGGGAARAGGGGGGGRRR